MKNENAVTVRENEEVEIVTFDKDAIKKEISDDLRQFGVGCCKSAEDALAPLASSLTRYFFSWIISKLA